MSQQPGTPVDQMESTADKNQTGEENNLDSSMVWPPQFPPMGNNNLVMVSVFAACEALWRCQELEKAASWLQLLHHAVLRDRLEAYDPSEAFLCLQGAALRFHENAQKSFEMGWAIWEESMWAAAALARVCVGPAWRLQLYQRKSFLYGSNEWQPQTNIAPSNEMETSDLNIADHTPQEVVTNNDTSPRSYSPMTASSFGNFSAGRFDTWYPPIPEVLPAAMLRFAASAIEATSSLAAKSTLDKQAYLDRRKHIAEAQRELVLAMCCATSEEAGDLFSTSKRGDWTIPGAHDPVARMLLFWLETATTTTCPPKQEDLMSLPVENAMDDNASSSVTTSAAETNTDEPSAVPSGTMQSAVISNSPSLDEPADVVHSADVDDCAQFQPSISSNTAQHAVDVSELSELPSPAVIPTVTFQAGGADEPDHVEEGTQSQDKPSNQVLKEHPERQTKTGAAVASKSTDPSSSKEQISYSTEEDIGALDWWYVLQVTRAATDLVSSGWRLSPRGDVGSEIVLCLLEIAERGMSLRPYDLLCAPSATDGEAREERLAAASSAAEAVSALASLGAAGVIPHSTQSHTVAILCRLQAKMIISPPALKAIYPLGDSPEPSEEIEWELEKETFTTQRESCSADMADLVRVLLSHQSSAVTSVSTLMRLVDVDLPWSRSSSAVSSDSSLTSSEGGPLMNIQSTILDTAMAIRILGASLWGEHSGTSGVPSLRVFWLPFLDSLCKVGYLVYSNDRGLLSPTASPSGIIVGEGKPNLKSCRPISHCHRSSLIVALEIASALNRLVYTELVLGDGLLTPIEWDAFVLTLDQSVIPWLSYVNGLDDEKSTAGSNRSVAKSAELCKRLRSELHALLNRLGEFLDGCATLESGPFYLLMDDKSRRQLHLLLLRKAIPYLEPELATELAVAVIRSWAAVGFLPFASAEWCQVAADILANAFAVYDKRTFGFVGGYVHSPRVRLEALIAITYEDSDMDHQMPTEVLSDDESYNDGKLFTASPLTLTRNVREKHLELIDRSILPFVISILGTGSSDEVEDTRRLAVLAVPSTCNQALQNFPTGERNEETSLLVEEGEFELRLYSVKLLGRLFRSATCERRHRSLVIQTLGSLVSMNGQNQNGANHYNRSLTEGGARSPERELVNARDALGPLSDEVHLSLEAIRQMELCLNATFCSLPHAHPSIPEIIDRLCSIIRSDGWKIDAGGNVVHHAAARRIGTIAALLPLCRLSVSHDRHLVLIEKHVITGHIEEVLSKLQGKDGSAFYDEFSRPEDIKDGHRIAPFVTVDDCDQTGSLGTEDEISAAGLGQAREKTALSLQPIVSVINFILRSFEQVDESAETTDANIKGLTAGLRSTCYDAITNLILSGVAIGSSADLATVVASALVSQGRSFAGEEQLSRCKAIVAFVEYFRACYDRSADEATQQVFDMTASGDSLLNILLQLSVSNDEVETVLGCRGLGAVLPLLSSGQSISNDDKVFVQAVCTGILNRLRNLLEGVISFQRDDGLVLSRQNGDPASTAVSLLSILYGIFSGCAPLAMSPGSEQRRQTFRLCHEICLSKASQLNWFCRLLGLRCAAAVVDRMDINEVAQALSVVGKNERPYALEDVNRDHLRLRGIILDVLAQQYQHTLESDGAIKSTVNSNVGHQVPTHEIYAKETEDINHFVVESKEKCSSEPNMAWMCGESILTCRLGGSTSRYRGWMEVIVRSPSSRKRRLVRLSGKVSLDRPDLTSSLWCSCDSTFESIRESPEKPKRRREDSDVMSKALEIIERCDASFADLGVELDMVPDSSAYPTQMLNVSRSHQQTPGESSSAAFQGQGEKMDDRSTNPPRDRSLWRSQSSYGNIHSANHNEEQNNLTSLNCSIHHWLSTLFDDDRNVQDVEDQLRVLGFTEDLLTMVPPRRQSQEERRDEISNGYWPVRRLQDGPKLRRALSILDRTSTLLTHKVALLFAGQAPAEDSIEGSGPHLTLEDRLLRTTTGSAEFLGFTTSISKIVLARHLKYFSGGLDTSSYSADGEYAALWIDGEERSSAVPKTMVLFHLVTLMPSGLNNRKRHVGNDNVHIVYVEQGHSMQHEINIWRHASDPHIMQSAVVSGEFGFVTIFIMLLKQFDLFRVSVRIRNGLPTETEKALRSLIGTSVIARALAPEYVRRVAVMADLACRSTMEDRLGRASNWEERRSQIREMGRYVETPLPRAESLPIAT